MKRILFVAALLTTFQLTGFKASAQSRDEIAIVQGMWGMEKAALLSDVMRFSKPELEKFGPIYEKYMKERNKLGAERLKIIVEYADNYVKLDDAKADELTQRYLKNNAAIDKLQLKYYNKMKKEISAIRAAQWMQAEIYIQTMVRAEMQSAMPMIGELEGKMRKD